MTRARISAILIVPALALVCALAGCGGGSSDSASVASKDSTSTTTTGSSATSTTNTSTTSTSRSEDPKAAKKPPAQIALTSSAIVRGGKIPVRYTCDGANVSPPLKWAKTPAGTQQLFLFALDLTGGAKKAIRWAVGGIGPDTHGFAANSIPPGAVLGRNSEGHASWGGICPAKGKPHSFIFLLYALDKKIKVASGFNTTSVQRELNGEAVGAGLLFATYQRS